MYALILSRHMPSGPELLDVGVFSHLLFVKHWIFIGFLFMCVLIYKKLIYIYMHNDNNNVYIYI